MCRCSIIKQFIQVVTVVTNHDQSHSQWLDGCLTKGNQSQARQAIPECNWPIRGLGSWTSCPIMHIAKAGYPRVQCKYTLVKRGCKSPNPWKAELHLAENNRTSRTLLRTRNTSRQHCWRQGKRHKA